jgi:hypothetical protein
MLNQVLQEIETAKGPITMGELSRKLGIELTALEGMIQFWVQKGRLQVDDQSSDADCGCGSSGACATISDCATVTKLSNAYSLKIQEN